jgi:PPM family protein phosphatase
MKICSAGKTDTGIRRQNNEDAFLLLPTQRCFAVADGMGGAVAGEVASGIFVAAVDDIFAPCSPRNADDISTLVREVFKAGNERIVQTAEQTPKYQGMGCTAELLAFFDDHYTLGHVGDSRTYLLRKGELRQLTKDHSLVQHQVDEGLLTQREARSHYMKNVILRALGIDRSLPLDLIRGRVLPSDIFLLCSDGLSDMVDDEDIRGILALEDGLEDKATLLVEAALRAGGRDNVTVVLCQADSPD